MEPGYMTPVRAVISRIREQVCLERGDLEDHVSLYFEDSGKSVFSIPKPIEDNGYNDGQSIEIGNQLEQCGLDLFPLNCNRIPDT